MTASTDIVPVPPAPTTPVGPPDVSGPAVTTAAVNPSPAVGGYVDVGIIPRDDDAGDVDTTTAPGGDDVFD